MRELSQELIDDILDKFHNPYTLKVCSLACIKWSHRNRKHPLRRAHLTSKKDLELWCARIRPGLLG